jgi:tetratricopeptide (TPR) repeat protein
MSTYAVNYWIALQTTRDGYNVFGYHVVNFLFHLASSFAIFFIVLLFFKRRVVIPGLEPTLAAVFAGLLFGLHTINTETVVYLSSRSSAMVTMFFLWSFYAYIVSDKDGKLRVLTLVASLLLFAGGLLSKEIAITLPAMIFYYETLVNRGAWENSTAGKTVAGLAGRLLPHGAVALAYLGLRKIVLHENLVAHLTTRGGGPAAPHLTAQLATQSKAWVLYVREMLWPTGLSIDKPFPVSLRFSDPAVILSVAVILAVIVLALHLRKRHPLITFGTLWFFTALLPTSVFRLNVPVNDHRLYLPGFGAVLIFTYVAARLYVRFREDSRTHFRVFAAVCVATLVFMGLGTFKRNMAFATEETIWRDVILKDSKSVRGYNNLGIFYEQAGQLDLAILAIKYYRKTASIAPMFLNPYINLGNVYHKKKNYKLAEERMKRAIVLDPLSALARYNLGNIYREWGRMDDAVETYLAALRLNPRYIEAANNLANIHFKEGRYKLAIEFYQKALRIDPTFAMSYYNMGLSYENLRMEDKAIDNYNMFIKYWLGEEKYRRVAAQKIRALSSRNQ